MSKQVIIGPNLYYITVATKPHPVLDKIVERIKKQNEQIQILGLQENRTIGWEGTANFGVSSMLPAQCVNVGNYCIGAMGLGAAMAEARTITRQVQSPAN